MPASGSIGTMYLEWILSAGTLKPQIQSLNILDSMDVKNVKATEYLAMTANLENRIWDFEANFLLVNLLHPEQVKFLLNQKKLWPEFLQYFANDSNTQKLVSAARAALEAGEQVRTLIDPSRVVLVGPTNAGKSTLFNSLAGTQRAIVTDHPGTTRDALSELIDLGNWPVKIIDTAGLWEKAEGLDANAAGRTLGHALEADLILFIYDDFSNEDQELSIKRLEPVKDKLIIVKNKQDLSGKADDKLPTLFDDCPCLSISAKNGTGMAELEKTILSKIRPAELPKSEQPVCFTRRQKLLLETITESKQAENKKVLSLLKHINDLDEILNWTKKYEKEKNN